MTNVKGRPFFDLLREAGLPVKSVVVLGIFVHVECHSESTAKKAAHTLAPGGFEFIKITKSVEKAKYPNKQRSAAGMTTWVKTFTAHCKLNPARVS